jgi:hypothetical protein
MTMAQAAAPVPCADSGYTCKDETASFDNATHLLVSSDPLNPTELLGDNVFIPISLPFSFKFYGQTYNNAYVSMNGLITFLAGTTQSLNHEITDPATPSASIVPFWTDLISTGAPATTALVGAAPNRRFVIQWSNAAVNTDPDHSATVTMQAILCENGDILFKYVDVSTSNLYAQGKSATIGIKDHTGTQGIQYSYDAPVISSLLAIHFSPLPPDTAGPQITITTPPNGAVYQLKQAVNADYGCTDPSGVKTCNGPVANGLAIDTSSVGNHNFRVGAKDQLNNASNLTNAYSVDYHFSGFFPPVDISTGQDIILNQTRAGSSVPVKFSLGGNQGLNIFFQDYPSSIAVSCSDGTSTAALEETAAAGSSGLSYDPTTDQYNYVWKTDKTWATTSPCRLLVLKLLDGTEHRAYFSFTK